MNLVGPVAKRSKALSSSSAVSARIAFFPSTAASGRGLVWLQDARKRHGRVQGLHFGSTGRETCQRDRDTLLLREEVLATLVHDELDGRARRDDEAVERCKQRVS